MIVVYRKHGKLVDAVKVEGEYRINAETDELSPNGKEFDQITFVSTTHKLRYWQVVATVFAILSIVLALWR